MPYVNSYPLATGIAATGGLPASGWDAGADAEAVAVDINVTVAGTTGTYQLEGSMDGANWFAVDTTDSQDISTAASALTRTYTTTGHRILFAKLDTGKFWRLWRINATTLTGQTYSATLFTLDKE